MCAYMCLYKVICACACPAAFKDMHFLRVVCRHASVYTFRRRPDTLAFRAETWTNGAGFTSAHSNHKSQLPKRSASDHISAAFLKHKHSWFKHWYRRIKRWVNYILHLPFRHVAGNLIQSDICFEFRLVIRQRAIMFTLCFNLSWETLYFDGS